MGIVSISPQKLESERIILKKYKVGLTSTLVAYSLFWAYKDTKITIKEDGLEIQGLYGGYYPWPEIKNLEIKETLPNIQFKINGASLAGKLKGHFRSKDLGNIKVFLDKKVASFIYFDYKGKKIIFNLSSSADTKLAYASIREKLLVK